MPLAWESASKFEQAAKLLQFYQEQESQRIKLRHGRQLVDELPRGAVVQLASEFGVAGATSLALEACASAQSEAREACGRACWCAWFDPGCSLFAPAVAARGVDLDRLLVVYPALDKLVHAVLRVVRSALFPVAVVDLCGVPGAWVRPGGMRWYRAVRALGLAAKQTKSCVLLLTDKHIREAGPLPVTMRISLHLSQTERLQTERLQTEQSRTGHAHRLG